MKRHRARERDQKRNRDRDRERQRDRGRGEGVGGGGGEGGNPVGNFIANVACGTGLKRDSLEEVISYFFFIPEA